MQHFCLLFIIWFHADRQSAQNRKNFYIAFIFRHNFVRIMKFRQAIFRRDMCFVQFLAFLTNFLSAKVTIKFPSHCKQKSLAGKICDGHGRLPGDYGLPNNQSGRAILVLDFVRFSQTANFYLTSFHKLLYMLWT